MSEVFEPNCLHSHYSKFIRLKIIFLERKKVVGSKMETSVGRVTGTTHIIYLV